MKNFIETFKGYPTKTKVLLVAVVVAGVVFVGLTVTNIFFI